MKKTYEITGMAVINILALGIVIGMAITIALFQ